MTDDRKREFWNGRAGLGEAAGTNDVPLKTLEVGVILDRVRPGSSVLDVGCGNGDTLIRLALERACTGMGVDFAAAMIDAARVASTARGCGDKLGFVIGAVPGLPAGLGEFDYVLTERCLINVDTPEGQHEAFRELMRHVKPTGRYLMIESFRQGLERTNAFRATLDLEPMEPPWHNVFLDEVAVAGWAGNEFTVEEVVPFSSTYHFLSRVVYARLARDRGEELRYDSDINRLACRLPIVGDFGPVRLWVWRRNDAGAHR